MDLNTKLVIKVQFNDEIRKMPIHNEDITYDELIIMMERIFKHKLNTEDEIIIKYKDEDNDLITISDDSDLAFALESSNILKLTLTVENTSNEEDKPQNGLSSNEIGSIRKELQIIRDHTNRLLDKLAHCNGDNIQNTIASGRASSTGGKDYQETSGKEFDPLSVGNQSQFLSETGSSLISSRIENHMIKSDQTRINNQEIKSESNEIHRPSPVNFVSNQTSISTSISNTPQVASSNTQYNMGVQNIPGKNLLPNMGGSNIPSNIGNQNMPPNMGSQNLPPNMVGHNMSQNMGNTSMPPNMGNTNMPPNMGNTNMPPNMGNTNMPPNMGNTNMPPNMGNTNMPPNMGNTNMPPNMGNTNMPPNMCNTNMSPNMGNTNMSPNMGNTNMPPNMGNTNMPPNMGNTNMPLNMGNTNMPPNMGNTNMGVANMQPPMGSQNMPPQLFPSNISKTMENPMQTIPNTISGQSTPQRNFYPNAMQPPRPSNFQGTGNPIAPGNLPSNRPPNSYFYSQNSPQFNPNYGNQQLQK